MTGCLGAALMSGVAAGASTDLESWAAEIVTVARDFSPDPADADRLDQLHAVYRSTYRALEEHFADLRRISSHRSGGSGGTFSPRVARASG